MKQHPLFHFLTFTSYLTPMVNFLPDFITIEKTFTLSCYIPHTLKAIYQLLPHMESIYHDSYVIHNFAESVCFFRAIDCASFNDIYIVFWKHSYMTVFSLFFYFTVITHTFYQIIHIHVVALFQESNKASHLVSNISFYI